MATFISRNPEDTLALGESWGREARAGWLIGLRGDLGAGKTQLVKGIARGLGVKTLVHSPTFTLVSEYTEGRLPLFHLDFYRLDSRAQIISAGLEEYLPKPKGVTVIEWIDRWMDEKSAARMTQSYRDVKIEIRGENERLITYEDFGA